MAILGLDLNDAALTGTAGDEVLFAEPGYALAPDGELLFGTEAWRQARRFPRRVQNRYWLELSDDPLPVPLAAARTPADLVHDHLAALWARSGHCEAIAAAVPAAWTSAQLGLFLGIAQELGMPVAALVDASVAASRREYPGRELLCVEAGLHEVVLTRMEQGGAAALGQRHRLAGLGVEALERAAAAHIAGCFVSAARFDPLHDANSEQALYDGLHEWLAAIERREPVLASIERAGNRFDAPVEHAPLAARLAAVWQPLIQQIRASLSAGQPAAVQLDERLAKFPGLLDTLSGLPDVEVFLLEAGAAARGAARAATSTATTSGDLRLISRLPWDRPAAPAPSGLATTAVGDAPTHVVHEARAYRIGELPFLVGAGLSAGDFGCALSAAGVSRQHCSIRSENGRVLLTDHSRFGTRLNGHRIDGSAVLQAGDRITVGAPPVEFLLVAEANGDGA